MYFIIVYVYNMCGYVCVLYMHVRVYLNICMYIGVHVCVCVCVHACTCMCVVSVVYGCMFV